MCRNYVSTMINFKNIALAFFVLYLANCDAVTGKIDRVVYGSFFKKQISDYYWRDYSGAIPCDAVKGGTDAAGNTTYIGQVSAADKCADTQPDIISATIHEGNKTAYAAYHSAIYYQTKHVKVTFLIFFFLGLYVDIKGCAFRFCAATICRT